MISVKNDSQIFSWFNWEGLSICRYSLSIYNILGSLLGTGVTVMDERDIYPCPHRALFLAERDTHITKSNICHAARTSYVIGETKSKRNMQRLELGSS